jgi:hypothetical protein
MGAAALVLALGVGEASAIPTTDQLLNAGNGATSTTSAAVAMNPTIQEGRSAAILPFSDYQPMHHAR